MVDEAKSRTQVAQLTTAAVVAIVLLFLTKPLQYLPNAVLAAVVFLIGLKLIDLLDMKKIRKLAPQEFWVAAITAAVVVTVGVEQGIILAIILSVVLHVKRHYSPHDAVVAWDGDGHLQLKPPVPGTESEPGLVIYRFGVGLFYANAERFSEEILALASAAPAPRWLVLEADAMDDIDYTGGLTAAEVADELAVRGVVFAVAAASAQLRAELDRYGVTDRIGPDHYYDSLQAAREAFHAAG
jgi:MFS superfamily sulfate permease-like transporter